ncbi:MAG TPA: cation diffusion facilitator family transporter, partial [Dehalococcoidia bacterium]|nr:cation diffusion facilitator family transporter [Dehalococcoidia bacterium]
MRTPTFAAALAVGVNVGLFLAKLAVGLISGSVAVLSDAIDSGEDIIAASVALVSVRLSARPPDETHPYGYGKVESIAAGLEAGFISLGAGIIVF